MSQTRTLSRMIPETVLQSDPEALTRFIFRRSGAKMRQLTWSTSRTCFMFLSKRCVAPQASKRLESGEISQEEFLNMAHKIKHFFQYQEEKQQHSENWEDPGSFSKKPPLLTTPPTAQPCPPDTMDAAELSYYEHKSKLRKTQVTHRAAGEEWEGEEGLEESGEVAQCEMTASGRSHGRPPSHKYSRARPGE